MTGAADVAELLRPGLQVADRVGALVPGLAEGVFQDAFGA